jgi:hypothetical protein
MDSHVCDGDQPDCAAYAHYSDPANRQPAEGARAYRVPKLTKHVPVRFDADVIDRAKQVAEAEGLTVSSWIRRLVARELGPPRPPGTYNDGAAGSRFHVTDGTLAE